MEGQTPGTRSRLHDVARRFAGLAVLCVLANPLLADEPFYYYKDGDRIVITNTPSRPDSQRIRTEEPRGKRPAPQASGLPPTRFDQHIRQVAAESSLSPALIKAVALVESGFNPRAVSPKGAQGLMQLMPATARQYGVSNPFDPLENLRAGATHLKKLLIEFDGNLTLALAAYNAGSGAVRRHGGVPNYRETREYVKKVHRHLGNNVSDAARAARRVQSSPDASVRLVLQADGSVLLQN